MAMLPNDIIVTASPNDDIVDVFCLCLDCKFNLVNSCSTEDDRKPRCNLKYIRIDSFGKCANNENLHPASQ